MNNTQHTPGPWRTRNTMVKSSCGMVNIADCCVSYTLQPEEMEANANMIAAAPELLEALDMVSGLLPVICDQFGLTEDFGFTVKVKSTGETREMLFSEVIGMALSAITKATVQTSAKSDHE